MFTESNFIFRIQRDVSRLVSWQTLVIFPLFCGNILGDTDFEHYYPPLFGLFPRFLCVLGDWFGCFMVRDVAPCSCEWCVYGMVK